MPSIALAWAIARATPTSPVPQYRDLTVADMNRPIDKTDGTYDLVSCVGTFTLGHVEQGLVQRGQV
jgi:hypothetical protein